MHIKMYKIDRNFACFEPIFSGGGRAPSFLAFHYKIQPVSDHVAKFHGHRPRKLGRTRGERKKTSRVKHKPVRNYRSKRPKNGNLLRSVLEATGKLLVG